MSKRVRAFYFPQSNLLTHARLAQLEKQSITSTWNGSSSKSALNYVLAVAPEALGIWARLEQAPTIAAGEQKNQFIEGLWERDVIELFLKQPASSRYVEFNFAATGAWWCQEFSSARVRVESSKPLKLEYSVVCSSDSWEVFLKLNYSVLPFPASCELLPEINISAIFGETEKSFLSLNSIPEIPADFHHLESFRSIALE